MRRLRIVAILIATVLTFLAIPDCRAQEHAPTLDVCKADLAVWYDRHEAMDYLNQKRRHKSDNVRNTSPYAKLPFTEVQARINELGACWPISGYEDRYHEAMMFYSNIFSDRMFGFIHRHHLWEQLNKEDAAGIR